MTEVQLSSDVGSRFCPKMRFSRLLLPADTSPEYEQGRSGQARQDQTQTTQTRGAQTFLSAAGVVSSMQFR